MVRAWSPASLTLTLPVAAALGAGTAALTALFAAATEQTSWFEKPSADTSYSRLHVVEQPTSAGPGWVVAAAISRSRIIENAKFSLHPLITHKPTEVGGLVDYSPGIYVDAVNPPNPKVPSYGAFLSITPRKPKATAYMHRYGWPSPSFEWRSLDFPSQPGRRVGVIELPVIKGLNPKPQPLPLLPHWPGLLRSTALFGSFWFAVLHLPAVFRHFSRKVRGQCAACGYHLKGLQAATCPECGTPHAINSPHPAEPTPG
jgi:hypothetical protein